MDEQLRDATRDFTMRPDAAGALALLRRAVRATAVEPAAAALRWLVDVRRWDDLGPAVRGEVAEAIERLCPGVTFVGEETCALGDQRHVVASFDAPTRFVLVPGGRVRLGRAPGLEDEGPDSLGWTMLTRPREVQVAPLLVEASPTGRGYACASVGAVAFMERPLHTILEAVQRDGLDLPSPDESEHAWSGGARTLFRWGDDSPESALDEDGPHRRPNAFGLRFDHGPVPECTAEAWLIRGADGGGRTGRALWVTQATSFVHYMRVAPQELLLGAVVRRVRRLPGFERPAPTSLVVQLCRHEVGSLRPRAVCVVGWHGQEVEPRVEDPTPEGRALVQGLLAELSRSSSRDDLWYEVQRRPVLRSIGSTSAVVLRANADEHVIATFGLADPAALEAWAAETMQRVDALGLGHLLRSS